MKTNLVTFIFLTICLSGCETTRQKSIDPFTMRALDRMRIDSFNVSNMPANETLNTWSNSIPETWELNSRLIFIGHPEGSRFKNITLQMVNVPCLDVLRAIVLSAGWTMEVRTLNSGEITAIIIYGWHQELDKA